MPWGDNSSRYFFILVATILVHGNSGMQCTKTVCFAYDNDSIHPTERRLPPITTILLNFSFIVYLNSIRPQPLLHLVLFLLDISTTIRHTYHLLKNVIRRNCLENVSHTIERHSLHKGKSPTSSCGNRGFLCGDFAFVGDCSNL